MGSQHEDQNQWLNNYRHLVSVKGVMLIGQKIPLLMNERREWELRDGKLERFEDPKSCVIREIDEEMGISASVQDLIDAWQYSIAPEGCVLILTYACSTIEKESDLKVSTEHKELALFYPTQIDDLHMPDGYKTSIQKWLAFSHPKRI